MKALQRSIVPFVILGLTLHGALAADPPVVDAATRARQYVAKNKHLAGRVEYEGLRKLQKLRVPFPGSDFPAKPQSIDGKGTTQATRADPLSNTWSLVRRDDNVVFKGAGFLRVRWKVEYDQATGRMDLPSITGDVVPIGEGDKVADMGGNPKAKPPGARSTPEVGCQDKYYYLNGTCRFVNNEGRSNPARYNIVITPVTYEEAEKGITKRYDAP